MTSNTNNKNKRIAINTAVLYVRMLLLMAVSLYTSRVILDALGAVDYGLYNVVGGVVVAIGFLQGTLNTTSSRYITVALGKDSLEKLKIVFSNVLIVNFLLALIILILSETIGLWFVYNKLQIPSDRFNAALWVYQMSIVTVMVNIISVPYNACIIAHEKMKAFAYISLFDAFGKLAVAFLLLHVTKIDKLILYSALLLIIQLIDRGVYGIYSNKNFEETKSKIKINKPLLKKMMGFITWSSYGSFVSIGFTQGLNILLNLFFGPTVNAARAISVQVQNAITSFTNNFQTAINPQLIQSVATEDFYRSRQLLIASSKFSFYLLCIIGIPVIILAPTILNLWLKEVPAHTVNFVRLMLIISIWSCLANPLRIVNQAEGHIKKFQLYECTILLLIIPCAYIALRLDKLPEMVFCVHLVLELSASVVRAVIVLPKIGMDVKEYFFRIYRPVSLVFILSLGIGCFVSCLIGDNLYSRLGVLFISEIIMIALIYLVGLSANEKSEIKKIATKAIYRAKK